MSECSCALAATRCAIIKDLIIIYIYASGINRLCIHSYTQLCNPQAVGFICILKERTCACVDYSSCCDSSTCRLEISDSLVPRLHSPAFIHVHSAIKSWGVESGNEANILFITLKWEVFCPGLAGHWFH